MVKMVSIGRTKFGQNNRISLVEGLPDLLNLEIGDYVEFFIENGELIIRKETKKYNGFDFENEEIHNKLLTKEKSLSEELVEDCDDPELLEKKAREQYLKDKAERENKKKE